MMRIEKDEIGSLSLPATALYGIQSLRAQNNFPYSARFSKAWYQAIGMSKLSIYQTYRQYLQALQKRNAKLSDSIKLLSTETVSALIEAAEEIARGEHFDHFIVPALQGGAGTSINMNCNEIITNLALLKTNNQTGNYRLIDPIETANIFQSTNDVIPTSLSIASLQGLEKLEESINELREGFEKLETSNRDTLRPGYTQMQTSVPSSYGRLFSTFSDALSRDWWRVSRCKERLKVVNLGGSAIGTSLNVPRFFVMQTIKNLQEITQQPIARAENLSDATSNTDRFVEVHAILKAHAVNLEKIASDLRLLSSDLMQHKSLIIPMQQAGSSIMPGKKNPVISEYVISAAHTVYANDQLISSLCGQGCLELNAYIPSIGDALLRSIEILTHANRTLLNKMVIDIQVETREAQQTFINTPTITTALIPYIGYHKAGEIASYMKKNKITIFEANEQLHYIGAKKLRTIMTPEHLLKGGYTLDDLQDNEDQ